MFRNPGPNSFQITFQNGWTVSTIWGFGTYSENRNNRAAERATFNSATVEFTAWKGEGKMEETQGWKTPEEFLAFLNEVASRKE